MLKTTSIFLLCLFFLHALSAQACSCNIEGEFKKWHKLSIVFDGPFSTETAVPNPFSDYRLEVTFTNGESSYIVPGYFAGDGNAAESSAVEGNKWMVHFAPDRVGEWSFVASFHEGTDIAISNGVGTEGILHGKSGTFVIAESNKSGRDHRARGRLTYVGEHYLRFADDSTWFYKVGADAPENTLAYEDFDDVPNKGGRLKSWSPHQIDYDIDDAASYTWQDGKGSELLGALSYLASKEINAFSFLTFSLAGDDQNVFPHLLKVEPSSYNSLNRNDQWAVGVHKDRFDISRLAQWEKIFEYADKKGLYLHFKTQETENDMLMDGGDVMRERKLYYRELVARFSHHLALNWNLGEENTQTTQQQVDMAAYFNSIDPYHHNIVLHTYPGQYDRYNGLTGGQSKLTGASIQTSNQTFNEVFARVDDWVENSANAGKKWLVAVDEPGSAGIGIDKDPNDLKLVRHKVLWATMMAGGAGVEYYYGYQTMCTDLNCEDHRTRDLKYTDGAHAVHFFDDILQPYLPLIYNANELTAVGDDYVLTNGNDMVSVYMPNGGTTSVALDPEKIWTLKWYNPRTGVLSPNPIIVTNQLEAPDSEDWVAFVIAECPEEGTVCDDKDPTTFMDTLTADCQCIGVPCPEEGTICDDGDLSTFNDQQDGSCNCAGQDLQIIPGVVQMQYFTDASGLEVAATDDIDGEFHLEATEGISIGTFKVLTQEAGVYEVTFRVSSDQENSMVVNLGNLDTLITVGQLNNTEWINYTYEFVIEEVDTMQLTLEFSVAEASNLKINYINFEKTSCLIGIPCDDGDLFTDNDRYTEDCECLGELVTFQQPYLEAERAIVGSEWTATIDTTACSGVFLQPPAQNVLASAPEQDKDMVKFLVKVENAGLYKVFARVKTSNDGDDSFWVRANNGPWHRWNKINFPYDNPGFQWSQVGNWTSGDASIPVEFQLTEGGNIIEFAYREQGALLDKIFVTQGILDDLFMVTNKSMEGEGSFNYHLANVCPNDTIHFDSNLVQDTFEIFPSPFLTNRSFSIVGNGVDNTFLTGASGNSLMVNNHQLTLKNLSITTTELNTVSSLIKNNTVIKLDNAELINSNPLSSNALIDNSGTVIIEGTGRVVLKKESP